MKARTVRVAVHKVTKAPPGISPNPPDLPVDTIGISNYLASVYRPRINATFSVFSGNDITLDWDINRTGSLDANGEISMIQEAASNEGSPHIHIFIIGADKVIDAFRIPSLGYTLDNSCFIMGDAIPRYKNSGLFRYLRP